MKNTATTKVTKKDHLNSLIAMIAAVEVANIDGDFDFEGLKTFCTNEISLLDKKAAKAKEAAAIKKAEKDELCEAVEAVLTNEYQTREEVASQIEGDDVTVAKVGYRLSKLVSMNVAEKGEVTVPGTEGQKARKLTAYRLAGSVDEVME